MVFSASGIAFFIAAMRAAASAFTFSLLASASVIAFSAAAEASSARVFTLS